MDMIYWYGTWVRHEKMKNLCFHFHLIVIRVTLILASTSWPSGPFPILAQTSGLWCMIMTAPHWWFCAIPHLQWVHLNVLSEGHPRLIEVFQSWEAPVTLFSVLSSRVFHLFGPRIPDPRNMAKCSQSSTCHTRTLRISAVGYSGSIKRWVGGCPQVPSTYFHIFMCKEAVVLTSAN